MFSQLINASIPTACAARKASPALEVNLHRFRNRWAPPAAEGYVWCDDMGVWIPAEYTYFSAEISTVPATPALVKDACAGIDIAYPHKVEVVDVPVPTHKTTTEPARHWWTRRRTQAQPKGTPKINIAVMLCDANGVSFPSMHLEPIEVAQRREEMRRAAQL
ncbi:hypothetical protein WOLCODRAFT_152692 [Wolfiporia cocos MD-104 SS10]|uniref:Uncharacterized protein n=1 Tax=Wolfiporia cocos (strain MD-104) TaxID=742152 RepID=A0A2H3JMD1_WOLCO|nr:hypothetical protein WOLCODRAFT_152692 [Wolfiporia cocos MD-104 SS10]